MRHQMSSLSVLGAIGLFSTSLASADAVTDWNQLTIEATKGFNGTSGTGVALDSNLASRIEAIVARAVFDAANSIDHFNNQSYYYTASNSGSDGAAVAQAAHDVLLTLLPNPSTDPTADPHWSQTRTWLDSTLNSYLASLGVSASDAGIAVGAAAAAAAEQARTLDGAAPVTTYGAALTPTSNPGVGLWRQNNAGAPFVNPATGAPTGFDATGTVIQGKPAVDLNWRDVTPFSLTTSQKVALVAHVPLSPTAGSAEYRLELDYVKSHGQDVANLRTPDETAQALYYKQDAEIFINEAARIASQARGLTLAQNASLFALLDDTLADARIAAFTSKYEQKFWRPITALNADPDGGVSNGYAAWHPLAATPAHPSNTSGHSATAAAGFEILRAYFQTDNILPNGTAATLSSLPWLAGTNNGTGNVASRSVSSFTQAQLETGASRLYLGVHFGFDNWQGQLLGTNVADVIVLSSTDPAGQGVHPIESPVSRKLLKQTLVSHPDLYGYYAKDTGKDAEL
jgi:PAP2 superfamily protein